MEEKAGGENVPLKNGLVSRFLRGFLKVNFF